MIIEGTFMNESTSTLLYLTRNDVTVQDLADAHFRKSYFSAQGNCVEVAALGGGKVAVRDSKDPSGQVLIFTSSEWSAFSSGVKMQEFDF